MGKKQVTKIGNQGTIIPSELTDALHNGNGMILLEGRFSMPLAQLTIVVKSKATGQTATEIKLPISISKVEDMYRTVNLMTITKDYEGNPAGGEQGVITTNTVEPARYPDSETNGKYFVFLHGFNVSPEKARGWNSEVFKRLHQMGSKARFVGITWHGDELLPNYHRAVFQAFQTGDVLKNALSFTGTADVTIAAHSLGNMVVSHAIQDGEFRPKRYYSINAAVPREAYNTTGIDNAEKKGMVESKWKQYWNYNPNNLDELPLKYLLAANWHELFLTDDNRNKLTWKNRFIDVKENTLHYNFYSAGDEVVRDPRTDQDSASVLRSIADRWLDFAAYAWAAQEYVKGGTSMAKYAMQPTGRIQAGWGMNQTHKIFEMTGKLPSLRPKGSQVAPLSVVLKIPLSSVVMYRLWSTSI